MKPTMTAALLALLTAACASTPAAPAQRSMSEQETAALALVNKRIAAYNAHDIEAFAATYDEKVRTYVYPDRLLGEGRERMKRIFGPQFAKGEGTIVVRGQQVFENRVVSHEDIKIGQRDDRNIAIYTITNGLISEVRLIEKAR